MAARYEDPYVICTDDAITIKRYYFPRGEKRIPYRIIRAYHPFHMAITTGKARVWGSSAAWLWFHFDPTRAEKDTAISLDLGVFVRPVITPDDPAAVLAILSEKRPSALV